MCGFSVCFCCKMSVFVCDCHVKEVELIVLFVFKCKMDVGMLGI